MSSERLERLDRFFHEYVDRGRTPGVVTLVARHGRIVHVDAYGPADVASGRKLGEDAIVRMYSMTKPITSVAPTHFLVDPKEDLVAIYVTQLMGGDFALRSEWVTLVYQAITGP